MDLNYIKKLIKLLQESSVDEIEIEEEGKKVHLVKYRPPLYPLPPGSTSAQLPIRGSGVSVEALSQLPPGSPSALQTPQVVQGVEGATRPPGEPEVPSPPPVTQYHEIKSPIVGTFYRAPAPDAAPFVQVGSVIEPGTVLCIVEAMKLMNEIESDLSGRIGKILVENGQPVEYDQTLFLVEKL